MTEINDIKQRNERHKQLIDHEYNSGLVSQQMLARVYELKEVTREVTKDIDSLVTTIESQKEEIEGYKAITELAVKGLEEVASGKDWSHIMAQKAKVILEMIERLQNE